MQQRTRLDYLDFVRVLSILVVFIFHSGRFFDPFGWHVKSPDTFSGMGAVTSFLVLWMMPLIFFVSGASSAFALEKGIARFVKDRALRLLVPLGVGIFSHVYVQVYLENYTQRGFQGSIIDFIPRYFDGAYGIDGGNFAWMGLHLWYLEMLFVFSVVLLPLFVFFRTKTGDELARKIVSVCRIPGVIMLGALPLIIIDRTLSQESVLGMKVWGGWAMLPYVFFLSYGYILYRRNEFGDVLKKQWPVYIATALVSLTVLGWMYFTRGDSIVCLGGGWPLSVLTGVFSWSCILAVMSGSARFLDRRPARLDYCNEAVLPFYVLHQSVLIIIGFFVFRLSLHPALNYLIITLVSFGVIMLIYEFAVRRNRVLRFLFGMKNAAAKKHITA